MEELIKDLKILGLTDGEARAYSVLLRIGAASKRDIVREARISSSVVYNILERLMDKGLVTCVVSNGKRYFKPANPSSISALIEDEKEMLRKKEMIISKIMTFHKRMLDVSSKNTEIYSVETYKGLKGLKSMLKRIIEEEFRTGSVQDWLAMGVTANKHDKFNAMWLYWHSKIRPEHNVKARFILCEDDTEYVRRLAKTPLADTRVLRTQSSTCITVCGQKTLLMKYSEPSIHVMIDDENIADYFRKIFENLWNIAKLPGKNARSILQ